MSHTGDIYKIGERVFFVARGIYDYFNKSNFTRLKQEYQEAVNHNAEFFVALYSDRVLEKTGHYRKLKNFVTDEDRIFMLESIEFVDGAFLIDSPESRNVEQALKARILEKQTEKKDKVSLDKRYKIGYASGAFSNLHKGHIEHLCEMSRMCQRVIVAANSDRLIRDYKNKTASVDEETRREILSHIRYVDMAIITDDYDKLKAVERVRELCGKTFDAIFVGSDWKGSSSWEKFKAKLSAMGIDVVFTDRPENGISTSKIDASRNGEIIR